MCLSPTHTRLPLGLSLPPYPHTPPQALTGDAADNIPGVKGIGPKTAAALVSHFGGVVDMYARLRLADDDFQRIDACLAKAAPAPKAKRGKKKVVATVSPDGGGEGGEGRAKVLDDVHAAAVAATAEVAAASVAGGEGEHVQRLAASLAEMEASLVGVRAGGVTTLKKLAACRLRDVALYRALVTLREDVPLTDPAAEAGAAEAGGGGFAQPLLKEHLLFPSGRERTGAAPEVALESMSTSFAEPLRLLRQGHLQ